MDREKTAVEHLLLLEHPLIKVPFEQYSRMIRNSHRSVEKELVNVVSVIDDLLIKAGRNALKDEGLVVQSLDTVLARLRNLKRKYLEAEKHQNTHVQRMRVRFEHLRELTRVPRVDSEEFARWNRLRLDRILVDYLLREGYYDAATWLTRDAGMEDLVDIDVFLTSHKIEQALRAGSCTECLQWCADNKSKLKKTQSTIEFELRLQEYIELARQRKLNEAIAYAKRHLMPWSDTHLRDIQQAMALLAFAPDTPCLPYREFYDSSRWSFLVEEYRRENFSLYSLTTQSLLSIHLQAGLSALKTPMCGRIDDRNVNCPTCQPHFQVLAKDLPYSHHTNSYIICRLSHTIMDDKNPPVVLPNGYVYSTDSIQQIVDEFGGDRLECPRSGDQFPREVIKKVYIT